SQPDVLYVRADLDAPASVDDAGPGSGATALLRSDDGGAHFTEVGRTQGPMRGFALSDDGRSVWIGGPDARDGLSRSDDGAPFARVQDAHVECLRFHAGSLYVCHTFVPGGVMLSRSRDAGATLDPVVRFDQVQGPPACHSGIVHEVCPL